MLSALAVQSWTLYAISISLIFSRLVFRRITLGCFKKLQADDWLMLLVLLPYTASIVAANQVGSAQSATERKFRYLLEEMQIVTTWLVKSCLLVLYWRIFPTQTSLLKRRLIQGSSVYCCVSFLIVQGSLMLWCKPTEEYWDISTSNPQCTSYHAHTALTLAFDIPNTLLIMILPVPFIPTPRRPLLAILLLLSTLVLTTNIISHTTILTATSTPPSYLNYTTATSSLSILFANLPFLTSVVTAAPARIRQMSLSQWPRSRRGSWEVQTPRSRLDSVASTVKEPKSVAEWARDVGSAGERGSGVSSLAEGPALRTPAVSWDEEMMGGGILDSRSGACSPTMEKETCQTLLGPSSARPTTRDSQVPKMRLSGGLAEMGELSLQDTTQGWPIYWR